MLSWLMDEKSGESGQGMVEYGLILVLVSIVAIGALSKIGGGLKGNFKTVKFGLEGKDKDGKELITDAPSGPTDPDNNK